MTSTLTVTPPEPVPDADPRIDRNASFGTAVHAQSEADAVTPTRPDPPAAPTEEAPGERPIAQDVPNCVSENVNP